jgi:hypothetical protein
MYKRLLYVALSFLLLTGTITTIPIMASTEARLTLSGPATVEPGNVVSVVVGIENNPGLVGARLVIKYDREYLELRDAEFKEEYVTAAGFRTPEYHYSNNQLVIVMMRTDINTNWTVSPFITLVFTAKKAGSTTINLSSNDISNAALQQIEENILPAQPYTVNISGVPSTPTFTPSPTPSDGLTYGLVIPPNERPAECNGEPTIADVVRLLEYLDPIRRPNVSINPPAAITAYDPADPDRTEPNISDVVRLLEWLDPVRRPNVILGPPPQVPLTALHNT